MGPDRAQNRPILGLNWGPILDPIWAVYTSPCVYMAKYRAQNRALFWALFWALPLDLGYIRPRLDIGKYRYISGI